jgi:hypothetical protein
MLAMQVNSLKISRLVVICRKVQSLLQADTGREHASLQASPLPLIFGSLFFSIAAALQFQQPSGYGTPASVMTSRKARILCLDGGGIKGVTSLRMLQDIMAEVSNQERGSEGGTDNGQNNSQPPLRPCDYFDLICGTSTGGLIALMLGRLEYVRLSPYMNTAFANLCFETDCG